MRPTVQCPGSYQRGWKWNTVRSACMWRRCDETDEREETFTLTLSNASGGRLTDGEAAAAIENRWAGRDRPR